MQINNKIKQCMKINKSIYLYLFKVQCKWRGKMNLQITWEISNRAGTTDPLCRSDGAIVDET
jgi:hypothetical protein